MVVHAVGDDCADLPELPRAGCGGVDGHWHLRAQHAAVRRLLRGGSVPSAARAVDDCAAGWDTGRGLAAPVEYFLLEY